jgi:prepilin-type N-terminal cleavage/methylation domain-containing protein
MTGEYDDSMRQKRRNLGFTLAELLIVVAIIAVLVGVSIPIFTAQTKKAKIATVRSNIRSAKAAAYNLYLTEGFTNASDEHGYYMYDIKTGKAELFYSGKKWIDAITDTGYQKYSDTNNAEEIEFPYIFVYVKEKNVGEEDGKAVIQSCPSYIESSDSILYDLGGSWENGN